MKLELENKNNLIVDDLDLRNRNWSAIDDALDTKADKSDTYTKTEVDTSLGLKADKTYVDNQDSALTAQLAEKALKTEVGTLASLLTTAKTSLVNAINELFNNKANKAQENWITPTLLDGTTGQAMNIPQYFKDQFGIVHLRGKAIQPTNGKFLFTLPVGYRSITDLKIVVSGNNAFAILRISTDGRLYLATGNGAEISLDNIRFRAEG